MKGSLALVCLLWSGAIALRADTHYVSLTGGNVTPYTNWTDAASNNIQAAINAASNGETVLVTNGTYNLANQVSITNNITLQSLYGTNDVARLTIINGNYPTYTNRCFYINNGTLDGFTVTNGFYTNSNGGGGVYLITTGYVYNCFIGWNICSNAAVYGGGVYLDAGGIVSNCAIFSNTVCYNASAQGGGIYLSGGGLLTASRVSGNISYSAGGMGLSAGGIVSNCVVDNNRANNNYGGMKTYGTVANCVISNNLALTNNGAGYMASCWLINSIVIGNVASGGVGGLQVAASAVISNCQIIANVAAGACGGLKLYNSAKAQVVNSIIANNVCSGEGAGIHIVDPSSVVKNCLIYGNTNRTSEGGGVLFYNYMAAGYSAGFDGGLINCTIANNEAGTLGGGISSKSATGTNYVENCIIYGNVTTGDDNDEVYPTTAAYITNYWHTCCPVVLPPNQGNTTNNPLFVDSANCNYRLSAGSPCINTGTNQNWMTNAVDLAGKMRLRYITVDMGAFERIHEGTIFGFH